MQPLEYFYGGLGHPAMLIFLGSTQCRNRKSMYMADNNLTDVLEKNSRIKS